MSNTKRHFNKTVNAWIETDGQIHVMGCVTCGNLEKNHGWYSFCRDNVVPYHYQAPAQDLILERMKLNRSLRNK